jgi:hypothetical protein
MNLALNGAPLESRPLLYCPDPLIRWPERTRVLIVLKHCPSIRAIRLLIVYGVTFFWQAFDGRQSDRHLRLSLQSPVIETDSVSPTAAKTLRQDVDANRLVTGLPPADSLPQHRQGEVLLPAKVQWLMRVARTLLLYLHNRFFFTVTSHFLRVINNRKSLLRITKAVLFPLQIRLLIIDSVTFHFRQDFDDMALRTRVLNGMSQKLMTLAERHDLAVRARSLLFPPFLARRKRSPLYSAFSCLGQKVYCCSFFSY